MDIAALLELSDATYAQGLLSQDHLYRKIPEEQRSTLLYQAIDCGKAAAAQVPAKDLRAYCEQEKITIDYFEEEIKAESFRYVFAEFQLPDRIRINQSLLKAAAPSLKKYDFLKDQQVEDILLAHELYHFIENQQQLFTIQKNLSYQTGPFKRHARVHALSEIAAMSFAQSVLELDFSPVLLNIVLLDPVAPEYSETLIKRLLVID